VVSLNRVLSTWEDVSVQLRRTSMSWRGIPLSDKDADTFTEAIVMCSLHLIDLSSRHGGIGPDREIIAWARILASLDVYDLGSFLSDVATLLRNVVEPTTYGWFKHQLSGKYPFVGAFLAPIRGILSSFLEDPNPVEFRVCYQFFSFLTHLSFVDIDFDVEPEYEEMELYLQSLTYPEAIVTEMNSIMKEWMQGFSITEDTYRPSHGPGATAELSAVATYLEKYRYLGTDQLLSYVFSHYAGFDVSTFYPHSKCSWSRQSVLVSVPKSIKARRTISKEPTSLMYNQQGVHRSLKQFVRVHDFLSGHIDLGRQSMNAVLAIRSSLDQKFATIDLSSASDTVTHRLVKLVFRGTFVYPFLVGLRSQTVRLPSGKVLTMAKYAPMGSALCFPVETLIFACAVELAVRRARRTHLGSYPEWRVYGDDIIVSDAIYDDVVLVLESLGFKINDSKSFRSPSRFRESCGGHGYDGIDVTPMKISRRFVSVKGRITSRRASSYEGLIDMANTAYVYQFSLLRAWIIRVLLGCPLGPPLFSGEIQGALYSPMPDNYQARSRLNWDPVVRLVSRPSYQRQEIQVVVSRAKSVKDDLAPDLVKARYFETLRLSSVRKGDDMFSPEHLIQVPRGSERPRLRKTWVEKPIV